MRTREEIEKKLINSVKDAHAYTPEERDMRILNIGVHNGLEILLDIRDSNVYILQKARIYSGVIFNYFTIKTIGDGE